MTLCYDKIVKTLPGPTKSMIVKGGEPFCTETDTQKDKRHSVTFVEFCNNVDIIVHT